MEIKEAEYSRSVKELSGESFRKININLCAISPRLVSLYSPFPSIAAMSS